MKHCYVHAVGIVSALGAGVASTRAALMRGDTCGMRIEHDWLPHGESCVGRVTAELAALPTEFVEDDCRNNRLLGAAYGQIALPVEKAKEQFGAQRLAVVIGTSTSGIAAGEQAMATKVKRGEFPPSFRIASRRSAPPRRSRRATSERGGPRTLSRPRARPARRR